MRIQSDVQWNRAGKLLRERHIGPEKHVLLQENVATYLTHLGEDSVEEGRWQAKLERDLQHPYTDSQVLQHVDELQADLKSRLSELPAYPQRIYVTGSFVRGRLGQNSDLDTIFVFPEEARELDLEDALREEAENRLSPFAVFSDQEGMLTTLLTMSGARLQLQPEVLNEPGSLRRAYEETLANRGIHVDGDACHRDEGATPERRETSPVLEWLTSRAWSESNTHEQKWDRLQGSSWKSRARRCALGVAGSLAGLPGVSWALDRIVDQREKQLAHPQVGRGVLEGGAHSHGGQCPIPRWAGGSWRGVPTPTGGNAPSTGGQRGPGGGAHSHGGQWRLAELSRLKPGARPCRRGGDEERQARRETSPPRRTEERQTRRETSPPRRTEERQALRETSRLGELRSIKR